MEGQRAFHVDFFTPMHTAVGVEHLFCLLTSQTQIKHPTTTMR